MITATPTRVNQEEESVFALVRSDSGETNEIWLGSVSTDSKEHEAGLLSSLTVEGLYESDLSNIGHYFNPFCGDEFPEIPRIFSYDGDFFVEGFVDIHEGTNEDIADNLDAFRETYRRALTLIERARRGEPLFVGFENIERHESYWRSRAPHPLDTLPQTEPPPLIKHKRFPGASKARPSLEAKLMSIDFSSATSGGNRQQFRVWACVEPDGYARRSVPVSGEFSNEGSSAIQRNVFFHPDGRVQTWSADRVSHRRTNFYGRRLAVGQKLVIWNDDYLRSQVFEISRVDQIL